MQTRLLTMLMAGALLAFGQETAKPAETKVSAVIPVKTLSGDSFERLARLLRAFKADFSTDDKLRVIVVHAPPDIVEQMKRVVSELDRPESDAALGRNFEMTLSLLRCSAKPGESAMTLPADLEGVAKQLRSTMQCKNVELWDVLPLRAQEGRQTLHTARLPARLTGPAESGGPTIHINASPDAVVQKADGRVVRFGVFGVTLTLPIVTESLPNHKQVQMFKSEIRTSGDFKEGQKTVLGKAGLDDNSSVFVVVALKVLD